jgi:hypothetical protein
MSSRRESLNSTPEDPTRRFSIVTKLVHYTSKFATNDDERRSGLQTPVRTQPPPMSRAERRRSTLEIIDRLVFDFNLKT